MKNLTAAILLALFCLLSTDVISQNEFTGNMSNDYTDPDNWSNGYVGGIIPSNLTATIPSGAQVNMSGFNNYVYGQIINDGEIVNTGYIYIYSSSGGAWLAGIQNYGELTNTGTIDIAIDGGSGYLNNSGTMSNSGTINCTYDLGNSGVFYNSGNIYMLSTSSSLSNYGELDNTGTLEIHGTMQNNDITYNSGEFYNYGLVQNGGVFYSCFGTFWGFPPTINNIDITDCPTIEICDGIDNDFDGDIDEDFADTDGDGTADCLDIEECDGLDNDGDGNVDEGFDSDGDGLADCFDTEECDGLDNDGNGQIDEFCGCTDINSCNYDSTAAYDDGTCVPYGPTAESYCLYSSDGSCLIPNNICDGGDDFNNGLTLNQTLSLDDIVEIKITTTSTMLEGWFQIVFNGQIVNQYYSWQPGCDPTIEYTLTPAQLATQNPGDDYLAIIWWSAAAISTCVVDVVGVDNVLGCTDPSACNYDVDKFCDDGSCILPDGCADPTACNWDSLAQCDDGSCTYPGCNDTQACNFDPLAACNDSSCEFTTCAGCTDPGSCNYDSTATISDTSCFSLDECGVCGGTGTSGCIDTTACNYDSTAGCDSGICEFSSCQVPGCTIQSACNYDSISTIDDGTCEFISCAGCLYSNACNFDTAATIDDGSCEYVSCETHGCMAITACNYNPSAAIEDGSCEYLSCSGCTSTLACNYDSLATLDDGNCDFTTCAGCTYLNAPEYDSSATIDDGSCTTLPAQACAGDMNGDLEVDTQDLLQFLGAFGSNCN
jgi:hypothetical protein